MNSIYFSSKNKLLEKFFKKLKLLFVSDNILDERISMKIWLFRYKIMFFVDSLIKLCKGEK